MLKAIAALLANLLVLLAMGLVSETEVAWAGDRTEVEVLEAELRRSGVALDEASLIEAALQRREIEVRLAAIALLGNRGDRSGIPALQGIMDSSRGSPEHDAAAVALTRLDDTRGKDALREIMRKERSSSARLGIANLFAPRGDEEVFAEILRDSRSPSPEVRAETAWVLANFARWPTSVREQSLARLLELANDAVAGVRRESIGHLDFAVSTVGPLEDVMKVVSDAATSDPDEAVRKRAALTLTSLRYTLDCRERPMRVGCPEGTKKFLEDCRRDPKEPGCSGLVPPG